MSTEESQTPRRESPPRPATNGDSTWLQWPGIPIYGITKDTPPPDLEKPWDFNPRPADSLTPLPPPPSAQPAPAPVYTQQASPPVMPPAGVIYPSAFGPAKTPAERERELGMISPPNQHEDSTYRS